MMFTNKVYDILKWIAMIVLPALGTLYVALAGIWGFPYGDEVSGTIIALVTFLGVILELSNVQYKLFARRAASNADNFNYGLPYPSMTDEQLSAAMQKAKEIPPKE